jgi:hypothetical protein
MGMIRFTCPSCQRVLRVAEQFAGRQAKCPGCSSPVKVPAASEPDPVEAAVLQAPARSPVPQAPAPVPQAPARAADPFNFDEDQGAVMTRRPAPQHADAYGGGAFEGSGGELDDGRYAGPSEVAGWKSVRSGLRLFQISILMKIGIVIAYILLLVLALLTGAAMFAYLMNQTGSAPGAGPGRTSGPSTGSLEAMGAIAIVLIGFYVLIVLTELASEILQLVGAIFMLQVPANTGAKPLVVTVLVCQGVILAVPVFVFFLSVAIGSNPLNLLLQLMGAAAALTGLIIMLVFLHKLGSLLGSDALCQQVVRFAIWYGVGVGILVLSVCLLFGVVALGIASRNQSTGIVAVLMMAVIGLTWIATVLVLLFMYHGLLGLARDVIRRKALGTGSA